MAKSYSVKYFETSAKDNIGINELMKSIISEIITEKENKKKEEINKTIQLQNQNNEENMSKGCCF